MGLRLRDSNSGYPIRFRHRDAATWPVDFEVYLSGADGQVDMSLHGSSYGGLSASQREYVAQLVRTFAKGVEAEMSGMRTTAGGTQHRKPNRAVVQALTYAGWLSWGLIILLILVPSLLWDGEFEKLIPYYIAGFALLFGLLPGLVVLRRRLTNTSWRYDRLFLSICLSMLVVSLAALVAAKVLGSA